MTETSKDKEIYHMRTKADPTVAMDEAQPAARNANELTTIQSIRNLEHRDADGNVITDPDRSNPTRPRMERPLDTIRSFEAAIDGSYSRRASSYRTETPSAMSPQNNRRSGYFPGYQAQQKPATEYNGYYGNRMSNKRPESYADNYGSSQDAYGNGRRFNQRNQSDPMLYGQSNAQPNAQPNGPSNGPSNGQGIYPSHAHQQSYDTVGTASYGSDGTHQWGNSTDPSSENSSIERVQPPQKPDLGEVYGFNGFGGAPQFQGPILEEHGQDAPGYGQPGYGKGQAATGNGNPYQGNGAAPPPPPHKETRPRVPIKMGAPSVASRAPPTADSEKRKSWLKRRFSRKE
ncbi:hypothetical protein OEA41_000899 [Lepraria neglecta]|uniref:Uncharacterized protein n=1 Tax=Lepraria neglecta TaxID=209136 RepID=A0AAD9ZJG5_9LECA|nr:hypothetical protein OEA41_000899 [Lepraria neglecta]